MTKHTNVEQWMALHKKQLQLWRAKSEAEAATASLAAKHNALDAAVAAVAVAFELAWAVAVAFALACPLACAVAVAAFCAP